MFPNLEAEQARRRHTNEQVAHELGISRQSYESKKKSGNFKRLEIEKLLKMYDAKFEYLFAEDGEVKAS